MWAADALFSMLLPVGNALFAGGVLVGGKPVGDIWRREGIAGNLAHPGLVPFHAMTQLLVLDLLEPLLESGIRLTEPGQLTAPATRRLCNQLLSLGIVRARHAAVTRLEHPPSSDIVVELRCLGIALLDRLADRVCKHLDISIDRLPVIRLLESGGAARTERASRGRNRAAGRPRIAIAGTGF